MDPFAYQYAIGGLVFLVGLAYAARQGYLGFSGAPLRNLVVLLAGLAGLMLLQGYLQYGSMETAEPGVYTGDGFQPGHIGTALDYAVVAIYFVAILAVGTWFGRNQRSTKDFFFGGQRFSWWLIAFSLIATTIGSYSFVKYSRVAYKYGLASTQTYLNDWFWIPLFLFGWLPIVYFSRITSIPEYFQRRFGPRARQVVTALLLVYLIGYIGVNLFTMGVALETLLGIPIPMAAAIVATISACYVTFGGQTSVIMTDLLQGVMLLVTGLVVLWLGAEYLGGVNGLWENLPRDHRRAFANFNEDPGYNSVGIFWQDAIANSAVFYFLNQGILMRFMAARSIGQGRKAALIVPLVLMPVAAAVVASGGWVGKALEHAGVLPPGMDPDAVFFRATEFLAQPGVFGLIMAALTAALMSTVDTLVTAVAAIVVNDIYKPLKPAATEAQQLRMARISSIGVTAVGLVLVPVFMMFESIYAAHGAFTAAVTPPLVVALLLAVFWRRFTAPAAVATVAGGAALIFLSVIFPELVAPFAHGVPATDVGDGLLAGAKQYKYTRALYGLAVSAAIGLTVTVFTKPEPVERMRGLVWGTIADAIRHYKGSAGSEKEGGFITATLAEVPGHDTEDVATGLPQVTISAALAEALGGASEGDLLYVTDKRWWLGGLRSAHVVVEHVDDDLAGAGITLGPDVRQTVVASGRASQPLLVQRLYA